jgi:hypothetical protein
LGISAPSYLVGQTLASARTRPRPKLHHASADQPEDPAEVEMLRRRSFAQQGLLQARSARECYLPLPLLLPLRLPGLSFSPIWAPVSRLR